MSKSGHLVGSEYLTKASPPLTLAAWRGQRYNNLLAGGKSPYLFSCERRTIHRLSFSGWVPPRIEHEAVISLGKIEPEAACLQADQKYRCGLVPKPLNHPFPVPGPPIEVGVGDV